MSARDRDELKRNGSGYFDPTAHKAMVKMDKDQERFEKFLGTVFAIADLSGFHIDERIVVSDKKTGRVWK